MKRLVRRMDTKSSDELIVRDSEVVVTRTIIRRRKKVKDEEITKIIKIRPFITEPAYVDVAFGKTIGLPNYSSDRIHIGFKVPCYKEEILEVAKEVEALAREMMNEEIEGTDLNSLDYEEG